MQILSKRQRDLYYALRRMLGSADAVLGFLRRTSRPTGFIEPTGAVNGNTRQHLKTQKAREQLRAVRELSQHMKLPESFVARGLELAKGAYFMGHALDQLSHQELLAVAATGWHQQDSLREEAKRTLSELSRFRR